MEKLEKLQKEQEVSDRLWVNAAVDANHDYHGGNARYKVRKSPRDQTELWLHDKETG